MLFFNSNCIWLKLYPQKNPLSLAELGNADLLDACSFCGVVFHLFTLTSELLMTGYVAVCVCGTLTRVTLPKGFHVTMLCADCVCKKCKLVVVQL